MNLQCPFCDYENLEGADSCARCETTLADVEGLAAQSDMEIDLLHRPLGDLIADDYITVGGQETVGNVVRRLNEEGQHCAIVMDQERILGIFTERDVLNKLAHGFDKRSAAPVREYMTADPETLNAHDPVAFALNRMMVGGYRHIPILQNGRLAGLVSVRDLLGYFTTRFADVTAAPQGSV